MVPAGTGTVVGWWCVMCMCVRELSSSRTEYFPTVQYVYSTVYLRTSQLGPWNFISLAIFIRIYARRVPIGGDENSDRTNAGLARSLSCDTIRFWPSIGVETVCSGRVFLTPTSRADLRKIRVRVFLRDRARAGAIQYHVVLYSTVQYSRGRNDGKTTSDEMSRL